MVKTFLFNGERYSIREIFQMRSNFGAELLTKSVIRNRLYSGWTVERVYNTRIDNQKRDNRMAGVALYKKRFYPNKYNPNIVIDISL